MNRALFYAALRRSNTVFGSSLGQRQVEGMEALLDALYGFPLAHAANVLGQVYIETGGGMYPVKETVFANHRDKNPSDAKVIARLDRSFARGQLPWVKHPYWREGWFGRGQIQLTHESNYRRLSPVVGVDLVRSPEKALDPAVSAKIAAEGMKRGMFTGKKLADFDVGSGFDHFEARAIVNGDKHVKGHDLVKYAMAFSEALQHAGWDTEAPVRPDVEAPTEPKAKAKGGALVALLAVLVGVGVMARDWIAQLFGG